MAKYWKVISSSGHTEFVALDLIVERRTVAQEQMVTALGSGCGSVGRVAASDSRGRRFKSSHRQKIILTVYCRLFWKDENKEKEAVIGRLKNKQMVTPNVLLDLLWVKLERSFWVAWDVLKTHVKKFSACFRLLVFASTNLFANGSPEWQDIS